jgi:hypothetical protein
MEKVKQSKGQAELQPEYRALVDKYEADLLALQEGKNIDIKRVK